MKRYSLLIVLIAAVIVTSLAFSGCMPTGPGGGAMPTVPETSEPIKIGGVFPLTGPIAGDGEEFRRGAIMAVEDINAGGGLLERPLELVIHDIAECTPEQAMATADRLILGEQVDFLVTGYASVIATEVAVFGKYDVPYMHDDTTVVHKELLRDNPEYDNVFMTNDDSAPYGWYLFRLITEEIPYELPNNKFGAIFGEIPYNQLPASTLRTAVQQAGYEMVVDEEVPFGVKDWGPILSKIRATEPAYILFANIIPADGVTFIKQFLEDPTDTIIAMTYFPSNPEFYELGSPDIEGIFWSTASGVLPTAEGEAWKARYRQRWGQEPSLYGPSAAYSKVMGWAAMVERIGDPSDHQAIADAFRDKTDPYCGITGCFIFEPTTQHVSMQMVYEYKSGGVPSHTYQIRDLNGDGQITPDENVFLFPNEYRKLGTDFELPPWVNPASFPAK